MSDRQASPEGALHRQLAASAAAAALANLADVQPGSRMSDRSHDAGPLASRLRSSPTSVATHLHREARA